jgi:hypothetical protein
MGKGTLSLWRVKNGCLLWLVHLWLCPWTRTQLWPREGKILALYQRKGAVGLTAWLTSVRRPLCGLGLSSHKGAISEGRWTACLSQCCSWGWWQSGRLWKGFLDWVWKVQTRGCLWNISIFRFLGFESPLSEQIVCLESQRRAKEKQGHSAARWNAVSPYVGQLAAI